MNKTTRLPKKMIKLVFVTNKWNDTLCSAQVDGRNVADVQFYPSTNATDRMFHLYTSMPNLIDEGMFFSRASAEDRANWRANLS